MEFRDLKRQYQYLRSDMDLKIQEVINQTNFIQGKQVADLEKQLRSEERRVGKEC